MKDLNDKTLAALGRLSTNGDFKIYQEWLADSRTEIAEISTMPKIEDDRHAHWEQGKCQVIDQILSITKTIPAPS